MFSFFSSYSIRRPSAARYSFGNAGVSGRTFGLRGLVLANSDDGEEEEPLQV